MLKATKKSISLLQSKYLLIKTIDCIIQFLGAVEVDGSTLCHHNFSGLFAFKG